MCIRTTLVAYAGLRVKSLDTHTIPIHTTTIFITEALRLITYIRTTVLNNCKTKVTVYTGLAYSFKVDFLQHTSMLRPRLLMIPTLQLPYNTRPGVSRVITMISYSCLWYNYNIYIHTYKGFQGFYCVFVNWWLARSQLHHIWWNTTPHMIFHVESTQQWSHLVLRGQTLVCTKALSLAVYKRAITPLLNLGSSHARPGINYQ